VKKRTKLFFIFLLKTAIAGFSFLYIINKLNLYYKQEIYSDLDLSSGIWLTLIVLLLMPVNWLIESLKWRFLIQKFEKISLLSAFKAVLSGTAFAVFTPNRIGELAGRVFVLKKENRLKAVFSTGVGSFSQMIITLFLGVCAGIIFLYKYNDLLPESIKAYLPIIKSFALILLIVGILILFNLKFFIKFLKFLKLKEKIIDPIQIISQYKRSELIRVLLYSVLRYFVFLFQFYLLLRFFDVNMSFFVAVLCICLTYLVSSVIPTFTLTEIGIRGSAALYFMEIFSENSLGIVSATSLIWIINLAIPAIAGAVLFYRTKILS